MAELLTEDNVVGYLAGRGLADAPMRVELLAGGVSNIVFGVGGFVVKQSLPKLRVADDWSAPTSRVVTEADALELVARLTPGHTPAVIEIDEVRHTVVVERAPADWRDWKKLLLDGQADVEVARALGRILATWHSATLADGMVALTRMFGETDPFEQLRVDPYYRTVARRAPEVAGPVNAVIQRMLANRTCLVHGDFSPKNVLVSPDEASDGPWVIDFEVAHLGDPAFDLAFLLTHLTLKSLHRPALAGAYDDAAEAFVTTYTEAADARLGADWLYVHQHVGCMLLARVRGKSPAEYLTPPQRDQAWQLGLAVLEARPATYEHLIALRDGVLM